MPKVKWKDNGFNSVLSADWGYISYNGFDLKKGMPMNPIVQSVLDRAEPETALCIRIGDEVKFFILKGDFRDEYQKVFPDKDKCIEVYKKHGDDDISYWSDTDIDKIKDED